jgi:hypothetical protein
MRRRRSSNNYQFLLLGLGATGLAVGSFTAACGGSSDVKDAGGMDATMMVDTGVDTGSPDTGKMDSGCDAPDLLTLMLPDASGEGGVNQAACYGCIRTNCMSLLQMCNMDCFCRTTIAQLPGCVAMQGGSLQQAVLACTSGLDPQYLLGLAQCAGGCGPACGYNPSDGGDGG